MKLNQLTLQTAISAVKAGQLSAANVWADCQNEIKARNSELNAFLTLAPSKYPLSEQENDSKIRQLPLAGLPIAVKDNFSTKDFTTTASAKLLENFKPPYNATVIDKLLEAGATILGKTNLDAWAHGSSTETSDFGPTKNPLNLEHVPGGSSGGSAAAVAADLCLAALGSETAGSVRQPAALCGIVGFRPTYGRISRFGAAAMASSTDTPGFLTKTVADAALLTNLVAGEDPYDATTLDTKMPDLADYLSRDNLNGVKIGFQYLDLPGLENIKPQYEAVIEKLRALGAQVDIISSRDPSEAIAVYTVIQRAEVASNLGRYDGVRYGQSRSAFGDEAKRRIMLGTYTLSKGYADKYYLLAQKVRTLIIEDYKQLFSQYDVLMSATYPGFAKKLGASSGNLVFGELEDILVEPSALAGLPSINVPCYQDSETKLTLGLNIMGNLGDEARVIEVAHIYEQNTDWNHWAKDIRENAISTQKGQA